MSHKALLTGFTGVIGKRIAYELARQGTTVFVPIRARSAEMMQERYLDVLKVLADVIPDYDQAVANRLVPFLGDMRAENFGLNESALAQMGIFGCREIWHLAAALDLTETNSTEVFETNVGGTRLLIDFMLRHGIRDMHYFSTFAVHGHNPGGVAKEQIIDSPKPFRNSYENSKWQSEKMVWDAHKDQEIRAAIYRPSIVVGDSSYGRYEQFNAFNHAFDVASRMRKRLADKQGVCLDDTPFIHPLKIPGIPDATLNIVPLDYVVQTIIRLYESGQWPGKIFHITNPNPPRLTQMMEVFQESEPWHGLEWSSDIAQSGQYHDGYEKFVFKQYGFLIPYLMGEAQFDQTNVNTILNGNRVQVSNEIFLKAIAARALKNGWQEI